jgi:hypothetical protein
MRTAEPLFEPTSIEVKTAIEKLKDINHEVLIKFSQN